MLFPGRHQGNLPNRVVVTGAGLITSLGQGWKVNAAGFRAGRVAFNPIRQFDVSRQRVKTGGEVTLPEDLPAPLQNRREQKRLQRAAKFLLWAAEEALAQAGWEKQQDVPIVLGTTSGEMSRGEAMYRQAIEGSHSHRLQPTRVVHYQAHRQAMVLAKHIGSRGPITIIANACASGANAVGHAWEQVRYGHSERVITGGYEALSQLVFSGFDSLQALSPTCCRPFDAARDGLALGEGAGVITLESLESARRRGAEILGELVGYGAATDVHHLTQPHPQGDAALAAMKGACEVAELAPEKIGYVNAHGTGTVLNDSAEAIALNRWAGAHASALWVSSTKGSIGHLLGAAGAVEVIICLMTLREQWLPPMTTLENPDPVCGFRLVDQPAEARIEYALTNSFGFGGANASLILRRWS